MKVYEQLYLFVERNEKILSWIAFLTGFTWDNLTLGRIDRLFDLLILCGLLVVATLGMLAVAYAESELRKPEVLSRVSAWLPLIMQFSLGGLFSGLFVFYSRSGSLASGWPFVLCITLLLIGNEFFRRRYQGIVFQTAIYFVAALSLSALITPVLLKKMSPEIFILSTVFAWVWMMIVLKGVRRVAPRRYKEGKWYIRGVIIAELALFITLYFSNIIPPIPLAVKEVSIFHSVVRTADGNYEVSYKTKESTLPFVGKLLSTFTHSDRVVYQSTNPVYCFSSVFAPNALSTTVVHSWEYYNEKNGEWEVVSKIPFVLSGGRDGGFRGYTLRGNLEKGTWRCDVETTRGQLIGRRTFEVRTGESDAAFNIETR